MNSTDIHLPLNHYPFIPTLKGSGILLSNSINKRNAGKDHRALIIVIMAIIGMPVLLVGGSAESVDHLSDNSKMQINYRNATNFQNVNDKLCSIR